VLRPSVIACGDAEIAGILAGLDGRFVAPGPSGAPSRGRPEVLPTGRNFFSLDTRAVPTPAAWQLGWHSAGLIIERHAQEHGNYPARVALSAWGTANMRTGGDDIAQALALIGVRPVWEPASGRVTGFEILPASVLDRPRVDVTLRISGFFRDAFPGLIDLFDSAARAVAALDEPADINPLAARYAADRAAFEAAGTNPQEAAHRAGYRIFGSKPGAYGAGLQTLIDERIWDDEADLADAWLGWGQYAYAAGGEGKAERALARNPAQRGRCRAAQPGQPRARPSRQRRLLPVRGRAGARRAASCRGGRRGLSQRSFGPRSAAHPHACARSLGALCAAAPPTRAGSPE
jgi:cobaltochelatase CobN